MATDEERDEPFWYLQLLGLPQEQAVQQVEARGFFSRLVFTEDNSWHTSEQQSNRITLIVASGLVSRVEFG